uniref:Uncharacterized protein n=1 Tax=Sipha flava TaxID=143950 RepID=A0A2S2Q3M3_9HEMI
MRSHVTGTACFTCAETSDFGTPGRHYSAVVGTTTLYSVFVRFAAFRKTHVTRSSYAIGDRLPAVRPNPVVGTRARDRAVGIREIADIAYNNNVFCRFQRCAWRRSALPRNLWRDVGNPVPADEMATKPDNISRRHLPSDSAHKNRMRVK